MSPDAPEPRKESTGRGKGSAAKGRRSPAGARRRGEKARGKGRPRRGVAALSRLRTGEAIALVAAILLFILMFFHWYGTKPTTGGEPFGGVVTGAGGGSAWQTLELIPLFLMLAIVVAVGAAILRLVGSDWKPLIPPAAAVCVLGILAALLILIRIISPPGPEGAFSELAFESTLKLPIFLAFAAALGIAYGGWRAMGDEDTSFASIGKKLESPRPRARTKS